MADKTTTDVNDTADQVQATTDSSPVENNAPDTESNDFLRGFDPEAPADSPEPQPAEEPASEEPAEPETKSEDVEPAKDESEPESKDDTPAEDTKAEEPPEGLSDKGRNRFQQLANDNRQLRAENDALKGRLGADLAKQPELTPQTVEELKAEGMDEAKAEVENLRQELKAKEVIDEITTLNANLNTDAVMVQNDFPVFTEGSPEYNEQFASQVRDAWMRAAHVEWGQDAQGNRYVIRADFPLYDFYKQAAEWRLAGASAGAVKGQKAAEKQLAAAETPSSASPPEVATEDDDFLKGLNSAV